MKSNRFAGLFLFVALTPALITAALAASPNYKIQDRIKVADGGYDYTTFDPVTGRVYMARDDFTTMVDTRTGKVSQLTSASHGHMAIPVPGTTLVALPQGLGAVRIVDTATDMVTADIPAGMRGPDGATYDPYSKLIFAMIRNAGEAIAIDPIAHTLVATIPVGGLLEFPASDGAGKVFVNVTSVPEIAVIDVNTRTVMSRYKLEGCRGASGLAYASQAKLLISSCGNGMAKVLQADTGKEIASLPIGRGPDAVIYDPVRQLAFIPCGGDGVLEVISVSDSAHVELVQQVPTQIGTRTGTVDPRTGRLYLMASKHDPSVPPGGLHGGPQLAGSFEVLVVGP